MSDGVAAAVSGAEGTLTGVGGLVGTAAASSDATGVLFNALSGRAAATSGASGTLTGVGTMVGAATSTSGAVGKLDDPSVRSIAALLPPTSTPFEFAMGRA